MWCPASLNYGVFQGRTAQEMGQEIRQDWVLKSVQSKWSGFYRNGELRMVGEAVQ